MLSSDDLQPAVLENEIKMSSSGNAFPDWDGETLPLLKTHQIAAEGK